MFALTSQHLVERTPSGEEAWRRSTLLPDDRRVLGALREPQQVAVLLRELNMEPSTLEVVLQRLARRGQVRLDLPPVAPDEPETSDQEDLPGVSSEQALSSLLARHAPEVPAEPDQEPDVGEAEEEAPSGPREYDESPVPVSGSHEQMNSLLSALKPGAGKGAGAPSVPPEATSSSAQPETAPVASQDRVAVDELMRALNARRAPAAATTADLSFPRRPARSPAPEDGSVSSPRFLRVKDAQSQDPAARLMPNLPSLPRKITPAEQAEQRRVMDEARRDHAMRKRAEREAQEQARRDAIAERRRAEQRQDQGASIKGMSERLKRVLEEQGRK